MRKDIKQVIDQCFYLAQAWGAGMQQPNLAPLMQALQDYDSERFFKNYEGGFEAAKARVTE